MTPDQRLDYFRSEFEGKVQLARSEAAVQFEALRRSIRALEEKLDKAVHELKNLEMSVR